MSAALAAHGQQDAENNGAQRGAGETSGRPAAVLKLLACGAAISLQNRRAEAEALENERNHRETRAELAHANRAATMGQLAASIVHEADQPVAAGGRINRLGRRQFGFKNATCHL